MIDQTRAILQRSVVFIDDYRNGNISLGRLVSALEGSVNALEEQLPQEFYNSWYGHWGNLETALALGIEKTNKKEILEELYELEKNIRQHIQA